MRQTWVDSVDAVDEVDPCGPMKRLVTCRTCCTSDAAISDGEMPDDSSLQEELQVTSSRTASHISQPPPDPDIPPNFVAMGGDNPWLVCRSKDHGGKLFWLHRKTQETTWRQPLPRLGPLPAWSTVNAAMRDSCFAVLDPVFFGAPAHPTDPKARTGICGVHPNQTQLRRTCESLAPEHYLYPGTFLSSVDVKRFVMCEELKYNGQRRRDVPDLASGTLYIDVGDRAVRRKRHSFHHELWHMVRATPGGLAVRWAACASLPLWLLPR